MRNPFKTLTKAIAPGNGSVEVLSKEKGSLETISGAGVTWVNIEKPTQKEMSFLAQLYPFHPLELEDCLSKSQLPKIDEHDKYLFVVLHFPRFNKERKVTQVSEVSIFLGKNYLVTVHQGDLKPLKEMFLGCKESPERRQELLDKDAGYLLYRILDRLVDYLFLILDKILASLDEIEDKVFDEKTSATQDVTWIRRDIADQRRIIFPMRRLLMGELERKVRPFTNQDLRDYFSDIEDHITKVWEGLEEARETIEIYKDTDFMLNSERTNRLLAILTIVFTMSLPAMVLGAIYGMNINLPGGIETGIWTLLGPYTTFFLLIFLMFVPAGLMGWFFHRMRWI